jgi:integrase
VGFCPAHGRAFGAVEVGAGADDLVGQVLCHWVLTEMSVAVHGVEVEFGRVGGLVEVEVKSRAGRRGIALPDQLFKLITEHRESQVREREHAGTEWREGGWMFAQPNGKPIDPRRDQYEWKALLKEAEVREARLHDARHTAATTLLLLGVPERAVMDVMGWSNSVMIKRYAHVTARLRRDIADRLNSLFWSSK